MVATAAIDISTDRRRSITQKRSRPIVSRASA
jgi:hypothetical protein